MLLHGLLSKQESFLQKNNTAAQRVSMFEHHAKPAFCGKPIYLGLASFPTCGSVATIVSFTFCFSGLLGSGTSQSGTCQWIQPSG